MKIIINCQRKLVRVKMETLLSEYIGLFKEIFCPLDRTKNTRKPNSDMKMLGYLLDYEKNTTYK